jgi:hypothetical protein
MGVDDTAAAAALLTKAWVIISSAGWDDTPRPPRWQDTATQWKEDYLAWLKAAGTSA